MFIPGQGPSLIIGVQVKQITYIASPVTLVSVWLVSYKYLDKGLL